MKLVIWVVAGGILGGIIGFTGAVIGQGLLVAVVWAFVYGDTIWPAWTNFLSGQGVLNLMGILGIGIGVAPGLWRARFVKEPNQRRSGTP